MNDRIQADLERRRSNAAVHWSKKAKVRDNRAAAKRDLKKEERSRD